MKTDTIYPLILLIVMGIFTMGCQKEDYWNNLKNCKSDCIDIRGEVVNPNNPDDKTIARVEAWYHNGAFVYWPIKVGEVRSNEDGSFELKIDGSDFLKTQGYLEFIAYRDGYLASNYDGRQVVYYYDFLGFSDPVGIEIESRRSARIRFHLENLTGQEFNDLRYNYRYVNARYSFWPDDYPPEVYGSVHETAGEQYTYIQYSYKLDLIETVKRDSIFIGAGELGTYSMVID